MEQEVRKVEHLTSVVPWGGTRHVADRFSACSTFLGIKKSPWLGSDGVTLYFFFRFGSFSTLYVISSKAHAGGVRTSASQFCIVRSGIPPSRLPNSVWESPVSVLSSLIVLLILMLPL